MVCYNYTEPQVLAGSSRHGLKTDAKIRGYADKGLKLSVDFAGGGSQTPPMSWIGGIYIVRLNDCSTDRQLGFALLQV